MFHDCCATICHILRPKCTKFDFGWGCAPDPAGGAHSALIQIPYIKNHTSKGREERNGEGKGGDVEGTRSPRSPLVGFNGSYF